MEARLESWNHLDFNRQHRRKIPDNWSPTVSSVRRCVHLPAGRAEIHAARVQRVDGHRIAQHVHVAVALRQALSERLPLVSTSSAAVHTQFSVVNEVLAVALYGNDVDGLRLVG